ncbi:hypothetical protein [Pedobacter jejuensis]|uniref:Uncharacterized protein n=1 Tax=Pedobacter jejuensis TaxID=1268550 RepID=A0A3N0C272_9SPHI|nr:hypothetical protein [Pedobacter jejuensis]RNL56140.1 hypothetical protein D7004_02645 [Pedobacter jejuensis]
MNFPSHYLPLKSIFDLSLFGTENPAEDLLRYNKVAFSKEFSNYQSKFLSTDPREGNEILFKTCVRYLPNIDKQGREDIVKVLLENEPVAGALKIMTRLNMGLLEDEDLYTENFDRELREYIENKKITPSLYLFLQKHFLDFEKINPADYQNLEITLSEYYDLLSIYMKVQSGNYT